MTTPSALELKKHMDQSSSILECETVAKTEDTQIHKKQTDTQGYVLSCSATKNKDNLKN